MKTDKDGILRRGKRAITVWDPENTETVFFCDRSRVIGACGDTKEAEMIYDLAVHIIGGGAVPAGKLDSFFKQVSRSCRQLEQSKVEGE